METFSEVLDILNTTEMLPCAYRTLESENTKCSDVNNIYLHLTSSDCIW